MVSAYFFRPSLCRYVQLYEFIAIFNEVTRAHWMTIPINCQKMRLLCRPRPLLWLHHSAHSAKVILLAIKICIVYLQLHKVHRIILSTILPTSVRSPVINIGSRWMAATRSLTGQLVHLARFARFAICRKHYIMCNLTTNHCMPSFIEIGAAI